jgi:flagella synthesis protein FlgN
MATANEYWTQLEQTLLGDIPFTEQLLALLQQERSKLEQRQYDGYQQLISDKQLLLAQLEQHASERRQLLAAAGFEDEAAALVALDKQAPIIANAWRKLSEQWQQCQQLNEINERIAKRTRLVVGQILDILRGQNNQAKLYTKQGDARNSGGGRSITSA